MIHFDDIDETVLGPDESITERNTIDDEDSRVDRSRYEGLELFLGTVTSQDTDTLTVTVTVGEVRENKTGKEFKDCLVLGLGGADDDNDGKLDGLFKLPKQGTRVVLALIGGQEVQPVVLGSIIMPINSDAKEDIEDDADVSKDFVERNGELKITKKNDGNYKLENDEATVEVKDDGEINFNDGDKGVARKDDKIKVDATTASALISYLTTHTHNVTALGSPTGPPIPPTVTSFEGKISESSDKVKAG